MKKNTLYLGLLSFCMLMAYSMSKAQTVNVNLNSQRQTVTGFGGMNFPRWIPDLTEDQANKAFGQGPGQIGLSILRISVSPDNAQWSMELPTAQRARNHGAIVFATPWSPPASMKTNNSVVQGELRTDAYDDYASYLRDFANYMSSNGADLYAISVQNEPDYLPNYESCGWTPTQMRTFLDNNASVIPTRVMAPEIVHYKSSWMSALASASELDILANHNYGGSPTRYSTGKQQWMTEHYTSSDRSANLWPDALLVGKEVHDFMVNDYNAYIWWYIRRSYGLITEDGNVSKRGYVMSHFSKFVRPGYTRVDATSAPTSNVSVSAYTNGDQLVIVAINQNASSTNITFDLSGGAVNSFTKYETTSGSNVANVGSVNGGTSMTNTLAGNSITTYVGTIGDAPGGSTTVWLEAECGTMGSLWSVNADGSASNDDYVTVQSGNNSLDNAPGTNGQITYTFDVSESGNYTVWARVIAPTADDDSFWLRMDGGSWQMWNNMASSTSWTWDDGQSFSLSPGTHTLTVAYREDGTQLDKLVVTNTATTPSGEGSPAGNCSGQSADAWLEAECGTVGSLWSVNADGSASNDNYVTVQSGNNSLDNAPGTNGQITYTFDVNESGTYTVWARVIAPTADDDSFWLRMDGGSWFMWNNIAPSTNWTWDDSQSYSLSAGTHTLTVAYREDGTRLDKLLITNSATTPSGEGSVVSGCDNNVQLVGANPSWSVGGRVFMIDENEKALSAGYKIKVYPNPSSTWLFVDLPEAPRSSTELKIYNLEGRLMKHRQVDGQRNRIEVSDLATGMYLIYLDVGNRPEVIKFYKE